VAFGRIGRPELADVSVVVADDLVQKPADVTRQALDARRVEDRDLVLEVDPDVLVVGVFLDRDEERLAGRAAAEAQDVDRQTVEDGAVVVLLKGEGDVEELVQAVLAADEAQGAVDLAQRESLVPIRLAEPLRGLADEVREGRRRRDLEPQRHHADKGADRLLEASSPVEDRRAEDHLAGTVAPVERGGEDAGEETQDKDEARLVVLGDLDFLADSQIGQAANAVLTVNAFNWLVAREQLISIEGKKPEETRLTMTSSELASVYLLVLIVLPGIAVIAGISVYMRRRR